MIPLDIGEVLRQMTLNYQILIVVVLAILEGLHIHLTEVVQHALGMRTLGPVQRNLSQNLPSRAHKKSHFSKNKDRIIIKINVNSLGRISSL